MQSSYRYFTVEPRKYAVIARAVDAQLEGLVQIECAKRELLQVLESLSPKTLVIDFQNIKRMSSSMVEALLGVEEKSSGTRIRLTMTESLRAVFRTLNLDGTVFQIFTSNEHALADASRSDSYFDVCGRMSPPDEEYDMTVSG